jgi:HIP---CoA ligase
VLEVVDVMEVEGVPWASTPAMVRASASRFADEVAVEDGDLVWTFADLGREVDRAARALVASGVGVGDRVAIWAPNIHEWIPAALGVHTVGAVLVPLNTRYKGREAAYILNRSGARLLFTVNGFLDTDYVRMLGDADVPDLEEIVVLRGDAADAISWAEFLARGSDGDQAEVDARVGALGPDDLCDIMFTSGTTGHPKGVLSTHGQSLRAFETWSRLVGLRDDDRYLVVNPFFHTFGYKAGILAAVMRGATLLPHAVFDAEQVLRRIEADRVSMLPGPPALYQSILNHPDRASTDLSSLRLAVTGLRRSRCQLIERMRASSASRPS